MCDGHMAFYTVVDTNPLVLRLDSIWLEKPVKKADYYRPLLSFVVFVQVNHNVFWHNVGASSAFTTEASKDDILFRSK